LEKSILVVDDEPDIRLLLADILKMLGYVVRVAANGKEALDNIRSFGAPSMIVLDLMMPVMDGYEFWEEQHRDPAMANVPVIVITAGPGVQKEDVKPFGVLGKPIKLPQLFSLIGKAIGDA
jgi:CheY-like chemotaxis protein